MWKKEIPFTGIFIVRIPGMKQKSEQFTEALNPRESHIREKTMRKQGQNIHRDF